MKRPALLMTLFALWAAPVLAGATEDETRRGLERELRQVSQLPPPSVELRFDGIASLRYELVEAEFSLDGKPIPHPFKPGVMSPRSTVLYFGIVSPGTHVFRARLVFKPGKSGSIFSYMDDLKFKVPGKVTLMAQRGLVLSVRSRVEVDDGASDLSKRLAFVAQITPRIVAHLEDPSAVAREAAVPTRPPEAPPTAPAPAPGNEGVPARLAERAPDAPPAKTAAVTSSTPLLHPRPVKRRKALAASASPTGDREPEVSSRALKSLLQRAREAARREGTVE